MILAGPLQWGQVTVYAKWQSDPSRASDATYEIAHDGGVSQVSVDQTHNGGEWRYLGRWSFDPLNAPKVTLLGSLTGTLSADAIRFVAGDSIGGDIAYTHADQLGTIQKMTDASGSLAWDRTQRPFGETIAISAASGVANRLRFPGQYADETGLSYNYFRDYDPTLGRYLESDPIGLRGGVNTYGYVDARPLTLVDSKGLQAGGAVMPRPVWPSLPGIRPLPRPLPTDPLPPILLPRDDAGATDEENPSGSLDRLRDVEYWRYKKICREPTPPGLDACEAAIWRYNKLQRCKSARLDWDRRWGPVDGHPDQIANIDRAIENAAKDIARNCKEACLKK